MLTSAVAGGETIPLQKQFKTLLRSCLRCNCLCTAMFLLQSCCKCFKKRSSAVDSQKGEYEKVGAEVEIASAAKDDWVGEFETSDDDKWTSKPSSTSEKKPSSGNQAQLPSLPSPQSSKPLVFTPPDKPQVTEAPSPSNKESSHETPANFSIDIQSLVSRPPAPHPASAARNPAPEPVAPAEPEIDYFSSMGMSITSVKTVTSKPKPKPASKPQPSFTVPTSFEKSSKASTNFSMDTLLKDERQVTSGWGDDDLDIGIGTKASRTRKAVVKKKPRGVGAVELDTVIDMD